MLLNNPVLQRELLINLRRPQGFVLLFGYLVALGGVVYMAWPSDLHITMHLASRPEASQRLVNMFFLGQYLLASLIAPSFAAGTISGEKERKTYELLMTTPMRPASILAGKLLGSLCMLVLLIFSSLPIVMLCLPLGGTSPLEVAAVYFAILVSTATFGTVSVAWSSYFGRTASSLVVSYLSILPMAMIALLLWSSLGESGEFRVFASFTLLPASAAAICFWLFVITTNRMMQPPDLGSEGKDVVDEEQEMQEAVGLVINRDQFPDRLFAPPRRNELLPDGTNPVYDKEVHAEIFSQGTLMLRVVIQVSMLLALPLMGGCLFFWAEHAHWYVAYVLMFNLLVGPVFSAGSVTSERERGTLDLLLTTTLSPWTILWGKLVSGLRVSTVLTMFLVWPIALACIMNAELWTNLPAIGLYLAIILMTCLTTGLLGLFSSVVFNRTSISLMTTYLVIFVVFFGPLAAGTFMETFYPGERSTEWVLAAGAASPFSAARAVPLKIEKPNEQIERGYEQFPVPIAFLGLYAVVNLLLVGIMTWLFNTRWRVAQ